MGKKVDPRDFLLNTDYEMDKIVYYLETYLTPDQYGNVSVPHTLSFIPLVTGIWSKTADFSEPHALSGTGGVIDPSNNSYSPEIITCSADVNSVSFTQFAGPIATPTNFPFYVRVMGFEPYGSHKNAGKTAFNADKFILNTDYNYLKLYKSGCEDLVFNSGTGAYNPITITHNLGYHAQALFWIECDNGADYRYTIPLNATMLPNIFTNDASVKSYTDKFVINAPIISYTQKLQYRIYYDET